MTRMNFQMYIHVHFNYKTLYCDHWDMNIFYFPWPYYNQSSMLEAGQQTGDLGGKVYEEQAVSVLCYHLVV